MNKANQASISNIPPEVWKMVQAISAKSGSEETEVLRQCVVAGSLIELIKAGPDNQTGEYGGFSSAYLACLARRALGAPIDFLLETGQHPYQLTLPTLNASANSSIPETKNEAPTPSFLLDQETVEELRGLGVGSSFAAGWQPD